MRKAVWQLAKLQRHQLLWINVRSSPYWLKDKRSCTVLWTQNICGNQFTRNGLWNTPLDAALLSAADYQNKVISDITFGMFFGKCGDLSRVQLLMRRPAYDLLWQRLANTCISLRQTLLHLSLRMHLKTNAVKTLILWSWRYMWFMPFCLIYVPYTW